jgi:hypothetical protein
MKNKISQAQVGQMMKLASVNLRALSEENQSLKQKVSHYEKRERVGRIATAMEAKSLEPELSYEEKVAGLLQRDNLDVVEEAVGLAAPQMKLASVHEDSRVVVDGDNEGDGATERFAAQLLSI